MIKVIKFCIVGGINTLITLIFFYIFNKLLGANYIVSSIIGYVLGMSNSYILNKKWTFNDEDTRLILQFVKFITVNTLSLGINLLSMYLLVGNLNIDSMYAQIIATFFSTLSNYSGSRLFVFKYTGEKPQLS